MKILVVEDDQIIGQTLKLLLTNNNHVVDLVPDGETALQMVESFTYDLMLLDVVLPGIDGISLCQQLRTAGQRMPILLLTGQDGSQQKIVALNGGADDYVVKPFNPDELVARVQALLRRGDAATLPLLTWGKLCVEPSSRRVTYATNLVPLTAKEYAILELFLRNPKKPLRNQTLLDQVWESSVVSQETSVRFHIKELRRKLAAAGAPKDFLKTMHGVGYQLNPLYASDLIDEEQPTGSQIAELKAINTELRTMLEELRQQNQELQAVRDQLEQRVAELTQANSHPQGQEAQDQEAQPQPPRTDPNSHGAAHRQTQSQLQWSQIQLEAALSTGWLYTWLWKIPEDAVVAERRLAHLFQVDPDLITTGLPISQFFQAIHPDDREQVATAIHRAVTTGTPYQAEYRVYSADAAEHWVLAQGQVTYDQQGHPAALAGVLIEITERKQTELSLRQQHQEWQALFENALDAILIADDQGRYTDVNPAACRLFDLSREEFLALQVTDLLEAGADQTTELEIKPEAEPTNPVWQQFLDQGKMTGEMQLRVPNGPVREVEFAAVANFVPHRHLSILRDITDRKQGTVALQTSEARYRRIVETALEGIWQVDAVGKTTFVNERVAAMLGYTSEEMLGKTLFDFMDQDSRNLAEQLWNNRQQGVRERHDFKFRHRSGRDVWAIVSAAPIFDSDQQMVGALGMIIDITERKQIETSLAQSQQWLAAFSRQAPAVIYTLVQDTKDQVWFEYLSPACETVMGWPAEQLLQDSNLLLTSMHPDDRAAYKAAGDRSGKRLEPFSQEWRILAPTGELKWLQARSQPERRANGDIVWYGVILDITERKQLEEERKQVEADLRQREAFLSSIYDGAAQAIFVIEVDRDQPIATCEFRYLGFNPVAEQIGRQSSQFVWGKTPEEAFGPVIGQAMRQNYQRCVTAGISITYEEKANFEDGTVWTLTTLSPLRDPDGTIYRIVGTATEITAQKQLELSLQQSKAQLNGILDSALAAITHFRVFADGHWQYEYFSPGCVALFGYRVEELKADQTLWLSRVFPQDREQIVMPLMEKFLAGENAVAEYRFYHKDGSIRWISNSFTSQQVEEGWLVTAVGHDISERKQAEQKVLEQAMLLDITSDAIFVQDLEQRILYWNRGAEQLYGWLAEEALNQSADLLLQADASETQTMMQALMAQSEWQTETTRVTKTGQPVTVEGRWTVIRDQTGQPTSVLVVHTDITDKKQLEAQFYRAQRLESLGTLASGIAHDLNNVLTPLCTITHLLRLQLANSNQQLQELLHLLDLSAERAADMVKQITTFSSGSNDQPLPIQLTVVVQEVAKLLKQTFPKSIQIRLVVPEQPLALVAAGPTQIHQVLMNLCINARDAMPAGGMLTLSAQTGTVDAPTAKAHWNVKPGDYVVITVSDTGTGIPEDIQHRIFDPFFTTKAAGQGTGLGLSTSLGIIRNYGGFLDVESEIGRGTKVKVYLPVATAGGLAKPQLLTPNQGGYGEQVLLVDDEPTLQQSNQALLEYYGYRVLIASDGQQAIDLYQQHSGQIQLVVMDVMMPRLDGISAIYQLKQINPALKIVAVSGLLSRKTEALAAGGDCFLQKPYTAEDLLATIRKLLNQHQRSQIGCEQASGEQARDCEQGSGGAAPRSNSEGKTSAV